MNEEGEVFGYEVYVNPSHRVSELLGPDGEPLLVPYSRPKLGFDLRPKNIIEKEQVNK